MSISGRDTETTTLVSSTGPETAWGSSVEGSAVISADGLTGCADKDCRQNPACKTAGGGGSVGGGSGGGGGKNR